MIIEHLKCLPPEINSGILFDVDKAIASLIQDCHVPYIEMASLMESWFDIIVAYAMKADSIGESNDLVEEYMDDIPDSMEETLFDIFDLSGFCMLMEDGFFFNSPQLSLLKHRAAINFTEIRQGGNIWE